VAPNYISCSFAALQDGPTSSNCKTELSELGWDKEGGAERRNKNKEGEKERKK
jgi:hypothetical protein